MGQINTLDNMVYIEITNNFYSNILYLQALLWKIGQLGKETTAKVTATY